MSRGDTLRIAGQRVADPGSLVDIGRVLHPPVGGAPVWLRDPTGRPWHVQEGTAEHRRLLEEGAVAIDAPGGAS